MSSRLRRIGAVAAGANALIGGATLFVAVELIGLEVLADRERFVALALQNPAPIFIQDLLKFATAAAMGVLLAFFFRRLRPAKPRAARAAATLGGVAVFFLLANASVSLFALGVAAAAAGGATGHLDGGRLNLLVGLLAGAFLMTNGAWYLLTHWAALESKALPKGLCCLGIAIGVASFVPVLGLLALPLGMVWSGWLCHFVLLGDRPAAP